MHWNLSCRTVALVLAIAVADLVRAASPPTPEQVVRANARAWSDGDLPALLALFADDGRSYDRSRDPHRLAGAQSKAIGTKPQLAAYFEQASASAMAREEVTEIAVVADLAIAAGRSVQPPEYSNAMAFLTAYHVRDGQVQDLWHIAWQAQTAATAPDPTDVVRALVAAHNARDADRYLAYFAADARVFEPSGDPRMLADSSVDARRHEKAMRDRFGGAPDTLEIIKLFSVGDLVVEQSRVTRNATPPGEVIARLAMYRVRDGRIADAWLLREASQRR